MENTLNHNDAIRKEEYVRMGVMREEERVRMEQNTIIILSESSSSDDLWDTLSIESSGSGRSQITTKTVISSNKSSTFCPHSRQMTRWKHRRITHMIHVQGKNQQSTLHTTLK